MIDKNQISSGNNESKENNQAAKSGKAPRRGRPNRRPAKKDTQAKPLTAAQAIAATAAAVVTETEGGFHGENSKAKAGGRNTGDSAKNSNPKTGSRPPRRKGQKSEIAVSPLPKADRVTVTPGAAAPRTGRNNARRGKGRTRSESKLKVMILGGLQEIGKNITVLEYEDDIIVVDCGMGFPDEDMLGVDLVIPDFTYLEKNADRVRGVLLTHGHEDHIGGVPYLLRTISPPIYGTGLTMGILKYKLEEFSYEKTPRLFTVNAGDRIKLGVFEVEFVHVNHSIADSCALAIRTPVGTVVHTGDFKLDVSPIDGKMMDVTRLGEIGNEGVLLLLCESTNAERPGFTPSERKVGGTLESLFTAYENNRVLIATFSSNVHRVQQIINAAARHGRKVCVIGRSMVNVVAAAMELGYMDVPVNTLIDVSELKKFPPEKVAIVTTGSQGEPMSALYRIAFGEHDKVKISPKDVVILSATAIPGNEKLVGRIINALVKSGVKVIHDNSIGVHVSGHACQEELKLMQALTRPRFFMPVHGEYRHLYANKDLAEFMGMDPRNIFISEIGKVLELDEEEAKFNGTVPAGRVLVDGSGVGDVGSVVLRDRKNLAQDGLVVVVATVDMESKLLLSGPDLVSRGFVYVRESEALMEEAKEIAHHSILAALKKGVDDWMQLKNNVKEDLSRFFMNKTKRKPMILPVIMDL